jgi:hypothetical protein
VPEFDENRALALLLTNLGRKKRTENLLKIAESCIRLRNLYGSWYDLARRININNDRANISAEMLREFGTILELPEQVKQLIRSGSITSVDTAYRITKLSDKRDQMNLAKSTVEKKLSASDVRAIVEFKLKNPATPMEQAIKRVLESKSRVVTHHIVIMELSSGTFATLREEAKKSGDEPENLVSTMLLKRWNKSWVLSFGMRESDIVLKLSEDGFKALQRESKMSRVELKDLADKLIADTLKTPR